jgi:hypothetical protein
MAVPTEYPAFKEWHVIVEALGAGEQIVILRKGGIAEGKRGFEMLEQRFWLFPTFFHAQKEKTKPALSKWYESLDTQPAARVRLKYFADVVRSEFVEDWARVEALDPHHFWTAETVRERFDWSASAGLHVIFVRVHALASPIEIPLSPEMGGCKSWIQVPVSFEAAPSRPVLSDTGFSAKLAAHVF